MRDDYFVYLNLITATGCECQISICSHLQSNRIPPKSTRSSSKMNTTGFTIIILLICLHNTIARVAEDYVNKPPQKEAPIPQEPPKLDPPDPVDEGNPQKCFHMSQKKCPTGSQGCTRVADNALLCCNVNSFGLVEALGIAGQNATKPPIEKLHVINATLPELDVSQHTWRRLTSMSITDGRIDKITGLFPKHASVACLNISNNHLSSIEARALVNLFNLTMLDISSNNLTTMPNVNGQRDFTIDIKGNDMMLCRSLLDTLDSYGRRLTFINRDDTSCTTSKNFNWFNSSMSIPFEQVEFVHDLSAECSEVKTGGVRCSCNLRMDLMRNQPAKYSVYVDCSGRQLRQMPEHLPANTIMLNVSYNNITSLAPVSDDVTYEHLRRLHADYNQIESIVELEGTKFIDGFDVLSLKGNKLKTLPRYILANTFDRNMLLTNLVFLGNNEFQCDCTTAKVLKFWLLEKGKNIPDYETIGCQGSGQPRVIDLVESKVCQQRDWTDYIDYVIASEVLLLVVLVSKVSYDYWVFKTAGYLPWPANKMPKMPCDWFCE